ncbi:helix-turn-helix domain-containing protein [Halalkalibacter sp. AB-rgal2]|uniref:AraC family transcriptional regulator n=1 Tax=Halalkalibacter sp. AB-rgal2 TaxID=3242695 RepID=UPI00359D5A35
MKKADGFAAEKLYILPEYIEDDLHEHTLLKEGYMSDIGYFPEANHHFRKRERGCPSHIMIYCSAGEGWIQLNHSNMIHIKPNTFFFLPAHTAHTYFADERNPWSIYWFHIKGGSISTLALELNLCLKPIEISYKEGSLFIQMFNQCYDFISHKPYSIEHHLHLTQTIRYLLSTLAMHTYQSHDTERKTAYIEEAILFMENHLHTSVSLEDIAKKVQLSKQHLNHIFKEATGFPPIDYFLRLKIQRACQLLDLTKLSIKEVSYDIGFRDPYYFSRMFKKIIGQSPSAYRMTLKG